jgi:hypothetical protein
MNSLILSLAMTPLLLGSLSGAFAPKSPNGWYQAPLDEIENYTITVTPSSDATLNLEYHFVWKVLDSTSEGPLTWVKIGVPNRFVSDFAIVEGDIKNISYLSEEGSYLAISFNQSYEAGEVLSFGFSFHQERIFTLSDEQVRYRFNPGWFDAIRVKNLEVYWPSDGVVYENSAGAEGSNYHWQTSLNPGATINVDVAYPESYFPDKDINKQYSNESQTFWEKALSVE